MPQGIVSEHRPRAPTLDLGLAIPHRPRAAQSTTAALARAYRGEVLLKGARYAVRGLPKLRNNRQHYAAGPSRRPRMCARKALRLSERVHAAIGRVRDERHSKTARHRAWERAAPEPEAARRQRSYLPRRLSVQSGADFGGRSWRGIEQSKKACVCVVVQEERALIEDRLLSLSAGALQHELRQFLAA